MPGSPKVAIVVLTTIDDKQIDYFTPWVTKQSWTRGKLDV